MHEFRVTPPAPFSFEKTASFLSSGAEDMVDVFDGKRYTRLLDLDGRLRLALVSNLGAEQRPELIVTLMNGTERDEPGISSALAHLLGFDHDLDPFHELCKRDQILYGLSRDHYGLKPVRRTHPYEALVLAIASQHASTHFFQASVSPIAEEHAYKVAYAGDLFYAFPAPGLLASTPPEALAVDTISIQQARFLHELGGDLDEGRIELEAWSRLSLPDLLDQLVSIRGIGPVGAQLAALVGYGRLDCFPSYDPVVRSWVARNYFDADEIEEREAAGWAEQWGDLQGLVAFYIYVDLRDKGVF